MKKSLGANTYLLPITVVAVGTYDSKNKANLSIIGWAGIVNSSPAMISISMRKEMHSYDAVLKNEAFTVNIPSQKYLQEIDYIGNVSGRDVDKFARTKLTAVKSEIVNAPYVEEFPIVLECKLVKHEILGLHTMFIGEIKDVKVCETILKDDSHMIDNNKLSPIAYYPQGNREYYTIGEYIGRSNNVRSASTYSDKIKTVDQKVIVEALHDYYDALDNNAQISKLLSFFDWDDFSVIDEIEQKIYSVEEFSNWHNTVKGKLFNRRHVIETIDFEKLTDKTFEVKAQVYFKGERWLKGMANSEIVRKRFNVSFKFTKFLINHSVKMKINNYSINELS
ncbi:flavin reductase family protein [Lentisphaerota bacterium WC36G]|nr:flavin reductase family protein [Lentisphaerae bacterium WC36]